MNKEKTAFLAQRNEMNTPGGISRRHFFLTMLGGLFTLLSPKGAVARPGMSMSHASTSHVSKSYFRWGQLSYAGSWNPNPKAATRFLSILERRTSVEADPRAVVIAPGDEKIYEIPFLYIAGRGIFPELDAGERSWLGRYVEHGGFLFFDDASGIPDSGFFQGAQDLVRRIIPGRELRPVPSDHTVFQSFYLIPRVAGRRIVKPFLYGLEMEDLTPVLLTVNDLGGAWDGDASGYTHACVPGGEHQREMAFRMGINVVMYALSGNYKKDQVHIPFILKRRKGKSR